MEGINKALEGVGRLFSSRDNRVADNVAYTRAKKMEGKFTHMVRPRDKYMVLATGIACGLCAIATFSKTLDMILNRNKREGF